MGEKFQLNNKAKRKVRLMNYGKNVQIPKIRSTLFIHV